MLNKLLSRKFFGAEKQMAWAINRCDFCFECQFWKTAPLSFGLRSFSQNFLIRVFELSQKFFPNSQLGFF